MSARHAEMSLRLGTMVPPENRQYDAIQLRGKLDATVPAAIMAGAVLVVLQLYPECRLQLGNRAGEHYRAALRVLRDDLQPMLARKGLYRGDIGWIGAELALKLLPAQRSTGAIPGSQPAHPVAKSAMAAPSQQHADLQLLGRI